MIEPKENAGRIVVYVRPDGEEIRTFPLAEELADDAGLSILRLADMVVGGDHHVVKRETVGYFFLELKKAVAISDPCSYRLFDDEPPLSTKELFLLACQAERLWMKWDTTANPITLLEHELRGLGRREGTVRNFASTCRRYLAFHNYDSNVIWSRHAVMGYLGARRGMSQNTLDSTVCALKRLFSANGREWPLTRRDTPRADKKRQRSKGLTSERLRDLIARVRFKGTAEQKLYLSLASTYGFRRDELGGVCADAIDPAAHMISVDTLKGGLERVHHIPPQIRPYIYGYLSELETRRDFQMNRLFNGMCKAAGFTRKRGESWHSVRHSVITSLKMEGGVDGDTISRWIGWKTSQGGASRMFDTYFDAEPGDLDDRVLARHPFLPSWQEQSPYVHTMDVCYLSWLVRFGVTIPIEQKPSFCGRHASTLRSPPRPEWPKDHL